MEKPQNIPGLEQAHKVCWWVKHVCECSTLPLTWEIVCQNDIKQTFIKTKTRKIIFITTIKPNYRKNNKLLYLAYGCLRSSHSYLD